MEARNVSPVFVGRGEELLTLRSALAHAADGEPQVLVVGGEAGVGKTRLLAEFRREAERAGAVTAIGGCLELGAEGLPFAPFVTVLRSLHRQLGADRIAAAAERKDELARLLPELGSIERVSYDPYDRESRTRLFEATGRLLERLAGDRTLVLALEDLHWADRSTRELLGYLVRSLQPARLLILATYRADDVHRRHPLRPFLAELERLRTVRRIELPRLGRDEVLAQIAGISGPAGPDPERAREIFRRSEGNPFFVEELTLSDPDGPGLSASLRDLLLVRVEALPEPAQRVLRTAALGDGAGHPLLAAVAPLAEDELLSALRAAVSANLLVPAEAPDAGYHFRHALLREAVLHDLLPGERARLSRDYAEALQERPELVPAGERAIRLASYWYHAREPSQALPAVLAAILETRQRGAYAEQLDLLARAMELWPEVPEEQRRDLPRSVGLAVPPPAAGRAGGAGSDEFDLLGEAARMAVVDGQGRRGLEFVDRALRQLDERKDPVRTAWFLKERSMLTALQDDGDGWPELSRAYELVRDTPPSAAHAEVLDHVAGWQLLRGSDGESIALAERAVEYAGIAGATEVELSARITLASLRASANDTERAIAGLYAVRGPARRAASPRALTRVYTNLTHVLQHAGRSAEAVEAGLTGIEELNRVGLHNAAAFTAANVAEALIFLGEWERAEALLDTWREHAAGARGRAVAELRVAEIAMIRGEYDRALSLAAAAQRHVSRLREPQFDLPVTFFHIRCAAAQGRHAEALALVVAFLDRLVLPSQDPYVSRLLMLCARVAGDCAGLPGVDPDERRAVVDRIAAAAGGLRTGRTALSGWLDAEIARARGEHEPGLWAEVDAEFEPYGYPHVQALIRTRWAEALLLAGANRAREQAGGLLAAAHAAAVRLGAVPLREDVELLARRGRIELDLDSGGVGDAGSAEGPVGSAADDPLAGLGLTTRERDVLRLVSGGRSNRQIAEELFISPKTASVHVSNMMAKLGAASRGEAAALAHRLRLFDAI
ncbi:helix-turn-helix transcriptional regulator [Streptomyces sp. MAR4 CNY-716]